MLTTVLQKHQLHIWHINASFSSYLASRKLSYILSEGEKREADAFKVHKPKYNYITSHIGLRIILSLYINIHPKDLAFSIGQCGKPSIQNNIERDIHFNLSHSNEKAILALYSLPIGIDIEFIDDTLDFIDIANNVFTENELRLLYSNASLNSGQFFNLWTRKEALLKAIGTGINDDVKFIDASTNDYIDNCKNLWQIEAIETADKSYICHAAYQSPSKVESLHFTLNLATNSTVQRLYAV